MTEPIEKGHAQLVTSLSYRNTPVAKSEIVDSEAVTPRQVHAKVRSRATPERPPQSRQEKRFDFKVGHSDVISGNSHSIGRKSDESTVSEVTNPTVFQKDAVPKTIVSSPRKTTSSPIPRIEAGPFDLSSGPFAADPFSEPSPRRITSPIGSDDFSDPFFPPASNHGIEMASNVVFVAKPHREEKKESDAEPVLRKSGSFKHKARLATPPKSRHASPSRSRNVTPSRDHETLASAMETRLPSAAVVTERAGSLLHGAGDAKKLELPIAAKASFSTTGAVTGFLPVASARLGTLANQDGPSLIEEQAPSQESLAYFEASHVPQHLARHSKSTTPTVLVSESGQAKDTLGSKATWAEPAQFTASLPQSQTSAQQLHRQLENDTTKEAGGKLESSATFLSTEALSGKGMVPPQKGTGKSKRIRNSFVSAASDTSLRRDSADTKIRSVAALPSRGVSAVMELQSVTQPSLSGTITGSASHKLRRRQVRKAQVKASHVRELLESKETTVQELDERPVRVLTKAPNLTNRERIAMLRTRSPPPDTASIVSTKAKRRTSAERSTVLEDKSFTVPKRNAPSYLSRKQLVGNDNASNIAKPTRVSGIDPKNSKSSFSSKNSVGLRNSKGTALALSGCGVKGTQDSSDDETCDTCSLASARSDIRRLRTYMRRSMRNKQLSLSSLGLDLFVSEFSMYDESTVKDPMQRAGLRLLSAAVIPIQASARRHLALRKALTRMWAIVILQSLARRWIARSSYKKKLFGAIAIQAWFRGCVVRDEALLKECCAIEVQRIVRGHLATIRVYEDIFRITIVQSVARRKLAIDHATDKMILVLQLQGLVRGFLRRKHNRMMKKSALVIQTRWRAFVCQFAYQLDLLDIIIVQSVWRRRRDMQALVGMKWLRINKASTKIQAQCRGFTARIKFYDMLAALVIQTRWRTYVCATWYKQYTAARTIQSLYRGYICFSWLLQYLSARKIQTCFRSYVYSTWYRQYLAATAIQTCIRRRVCITWYQQYKAATAIQSLFRSHLCFAWYEQYKAATTIQACFRKHVSFTWYRQFTASRSIQACFRSYVYSTWYRQYRAAVRIQSTYRSYVCSKWYLEYVAATMVQSHLRRYKFQKWYKEYVAARMIQATVRCHQMSTKYKAYQKDLMVYVAATTIQAQWRSFVCSREYIRVVAAIMVQAEWKRFLCQREYRNGRSAARIQAQWRCFVCFREYTRLVAAIRIQAEWRRLYCRRSYLERKAATKVQAQWRCYKCSCEYIRIVAAIMIQASWRRFFCRSVYVEQKAATIVQTAWRSYVCSRDYLQVVASIMIQSTWRAFAAKREYKRQRAAILVQSHWRAFTCSKQYLVILAAVIIQSHWRAYCCRSSYCKYMAALRIQTRWRAQCCRRSYLKYKAALRIQCHWRSFSCTLRFLQHIADVLIVQSVVRRWLASLRVSRLKNVSALRIQTAVRSHQAMLLVSDLRDRKNAALTIQRVWRGFLVYASFMFAVADIVVIQSLARRWLAATKSRNIKKIRMKHGALVIQKYYRSRYEQKIIASMVIQCFWRRFVSQTEYLIARYEKAAATTIQSFWRRFWLHSQFLLLVDGMVLVQSAFRGRRAKRIYSGDRVAAITLQSAFRRFSAQRYGRQTSLLLSVVQAGIPVAEHESRCATLIQSALRGFWARSSIDVYRKARIIQATYRGYRFRDAYIQFLAARKIQATWRSCCVRWFYLEFTATRRIQAVWRGCVLRLAFKEYRSARLIQSRWRGFLVLRAYSEYSSARRIQSIWRGFVLHRAFKEFTGARCIQANWRGIAVRQSYRGYKAARRIQAKWRAHILRTAFKEFTSARALQRNWRCVSARKKYVRYIASRRIQSVWRRFVQLLVYQEYINARTIQATWRGFSCRQSYLQYTRARRIQAAWRTYVLRLAYQEYVSARIIQSAWRGLNCRQSYLGFTRAVRIQSKWRSYVAQLAYKEYTSARRIQTEWRCYRAWLAYLEYRAARSIQSTWRGYCSRWCLCEFFAARKIQAAWRCQRLSRIFRRYRSAVRIQSKWRQKRDRGNFIVLREELMSDTIAAAVVAQKLWRGVSIRMKGLRFIIWHRRLFVDEPAATAIQKMWRGYMAIQSYWHTLGSAIQVQGIIRGWISRLRYRDLVAAVRIQRSVRTWVYRRQHARWESCFRIQRFYRNWIVRRHASAALRTMKGLKKRDVAAIRIQTISRRYLARSEVAEMLGAVILLQCTARGFLAKRRIKFSQLHLTSDPEEKAIQMQQDAAARKIQRFLLLIKREVDREIQAAKKRRKAKKKIRKTHSTDADDDLLEKVWQSTVDTMEDAPEAIRRARDAVARELKSGRQSNVSAKKGGIVGPRTFPRVPTGQTTSAELRQAQDIDSPLPTKDQTAATRSMTPGELMLSMMTPSWVRNAAASYQFRIPPSRMATFSRDEMDQDFCLEEAWIDAEISHAKQNRQKKNKRRQARPQRTMEV